MTWISVQTVICQASSIWMTRTFRPDVPLCREPSNCSRLYPSGRLRNTYGRLSVFDKLRDFFPKHRYGKTIATARTMYCSCPDAILDKASRAEDVQPSGRQTPQSRRSGPYYDNYVQQKCNRPNARAIPSGCGLVMEAFNAILERRFQLTVRTLGQTV
jgi:hypothetical protein